MFWMKLKKMKFAAFIFCAGCLIRLIRGRTLIRHHRPLDLPSREFIAVDLEEYDQVTHQQRPEYEADESE